MLRAWRKQSSLREPERWKQWLATIVRNEAFRIHARVRPDPISTIEMHEGEEDQQVVATVERADLYAALDRLTARDREILEMRYTEDLTQAAIAHRLGIPEGTAKVRLHRARARLKRVYIPR